MGSFLRNAPQYDERVQLRKEIAEDSRDLFRYFWPLHPVQLFIDIIWALLRLFRPLAPHLIPLAVFSVSLPVIIFLSLTSGYYVWKSVAVSWEADLFLQYGEGVIPYAELTLSDVVALQPYDISLQLVVPANEANIALGNFMATLTLSTFSNRTIAISRKPAIVVPPYATPWSYLYNRPGMVDINIPMFSDFVVGVSRALAKVELGRRDQWRTLGEGHGRELAILSGTVRGIVKHHGIRGLVSRFPLISALSASAVFFFILFIALAACLMPMVEWHFPSDGPHELEPDDKAYKRRRSRHTERGRDDRVRKSELRIPQTRGNRTSDSRPQTEEESSRPQSIMKAEEEIDEPLPPLIPADTPPLPPKPVDIPANNPAPPPPVRRRYPRTPQTDYFEPDSD